LLQTSRGLVCRLHDVRQVCRAPTAQASNAQARIKVLPLDYNGQNVGFRRLKALDASRKIPKQTGFHFGALFR
jgi:hypothetical protein